MYPLAALFLAVCAAHRSALHVRHSTYVLARRGWRPAQYLQDESEGSEQRHVRSDESLAMVCARCQGNENARRGAAKRKRSKSTTRSEISSDTKERETCFLTMPFTQIPKSSYELIYRPAIEDADDAVSSPVATCTRARASACSN